MVYRTTFIMWITQKIGRGRYGNTKCDFNRKSGVGVVVVGFGALKKAIVPHGILRPNLLGRGWWWHDTGGAKWGIGDKKEACMHNFIYRYFKTRRRVVSEGGGGVIGYHFFINQGQLSSKYKNIKQMSHIISTA